jgi:hypothetical protein
LPDGGYWLFSYWLFVSQVNENQLFKPILLSITAISALAFHGGVAAKSR